MKSAFQRTVRLFAGRGDFARIVRSLLLALLSHYSLVTHAQLVPDGGTRTLANVTNSIAGTVTVGTNGSFTSLTLSDHALVTNSAHGVIGRNQTALFNAVRLTGASARWTMGSDLFVGSNGAGNRLVVDGGALLNSRSGSIGFGASSSNNVALITDSGSFWTNRSTLTVGFSGRDNQIVVSNGARLVSFGGNLGSQTGSSNNLVLVTGSGSVWTNVLGGWVSVGAGERGNRLIIEDGGQVGGDNGVLGAGFFGGDSEALVTGPGSIWCSRTDLVLGLNPSNNRLVVSNGAAVVAGNNGRLGAVTGSANNVAVVTGSGSLWRDQFDLYVGESGPWNRMEVHSGGRVVSSNTYVGYFGASNVALVTGAGSVWSNGAGMFIGHAGPGNQLMVNSGGLVTGGNTVLGVLNSSSNNLLRVSGAGSAWIDRANVIVGFSGSGNQMIVTNGARVVAGAGSTIGSQVSARGNVATVTGSGSFWNNAGGLTVGNLADNSRLVIEAGGLVDCTRGAVGFGSGNNNLAFVSGIGSVWSNRASMFVGFSGSGNQLLVTNGGKVFVNEIGTIGVETDAASNSATVSGPGSGLAVGDALFIGSNGPLNRLIVSDGGFVSTRYGSVGYLASASNNAVLVTGAGSIWSNSISMAVGELGSNNRMTVSEGGQVWTDIGDVGDVSHRNEAVVTGPGSVWRIGSQLHVGRNGSGNHLLVTDAGVVISDSGTVGTSGSGNLVTVTGAGSLWSNRFELGVGSSGGGNRLDIQSGATVFGSNVFVGKNSSSANNRVTVNGGTLRAASTDGTGVLDVRRGTNVINAGLVDVDRLVLTNTGLASLSAGNLSSNYITDAGPATPYPSTISLSSSIGGNITKMTVRLEGLTCVNPDAFDILLVSPAGQKVMLMSDAGGPINSTSTSITNVNLTFDDAAASLLPDSTKISSGTYHPTDYEPGSLDYMPLLPAPTGPYSTTLSSFNGISPNGVWSLYIHGDFGGPASSGNSLLGWRVNIQTSGGVLELNGGTLVTRGAVINNALPFVVGGPGGVPAVWEARAGLSDNVVAPRLLVGNDSSGNQLVIPSGVVAAEHDVIVGAFPTASTNNLLRVTGGTLRVLSPGRALNIRGGTNRLDAGLVDVARLVVTNTRGQFEMFGGTFRSPSTTVANGRVCVIGGGTNLATYQMLGGTHTFANNLTIATNGSLLGTATIDGTVTVSPGGRLTPGSPIGRMNVLGSVILQGAVNLQIDKSGGVRTSDHVTADGAIFYSGTLNVTDIGTDILTAGDRFFLFDATPYVGAFTTLNLPPLSSGLTWRNNLAVDGSIEVTAAIASTPGFSAIIRSGTNMVFSGTNGLPNASFGLLTATNVELPLSDWVVVLTNRFDALGRFQITNPVTPADRQRYFRIQTP